MHQCPPRRQSGAQKNTSKLFFHHPGNKIATFCFICPILFFFNYLVPFVFLWSNAVRQSLGLMNPSRDHADTWGNHPKHVFFMKKRLTKNCNISYVFFPFASSYCALFIFYPKKTICLSLLFYTLSMVLFGGNKTAGLLEGKGIIQIMHSWRQKKVLVVSPHTSPSYQGGSNTLTTLWIENKTV